MSLAPSVSYSWHRPAGWKRRLPRSRINVHRLNVVGDPVQLSEPGFDHVGSDEASRASELTVVGLFGRPALPVLLPSGRSAAHDCR